MLKRGHNVIVEIWLPPLFRINLKKNDSDKPRIPVDRESRDIFKALRYILFSRINDCLEWNSVKYTYIT